jgi:PAS domain S-box-containing protein
MTIPSAATLTEIDEPLDRLGASLRALTEAQRKELALLNLMEDLAESNSRLESANQHLLLQANQYRSLIATTLDGYLRFDGSGRVRDSNDTYSRMSGYERQELLALSMSAIDATFPADSMIDRLGQLAAAGAARYEATYRRKDGSTFEAEVSVSYSAATDEFILFARDISPRQQAEQEIRQLNATLEQRVLERTDQLRESQERVELALHVARAFTFDWTVATDVVHRSRHCADILGIVGDATTDTGRAFFQRVHPDDRERFIGVVTRMTPAQPHYTLQYRVVRPDGQIVVLQEGASGTFDANRQLLRVTGLSADVTGRVNAEESVVKLNQVLHRRMTELQSANHELESFAYSISHDLRAPLRSIDGFSKILLRDCAALLDPKHQDELQRIRQSSQRMGDLIDNLLELSRTTRADLRRAQVDLSDIARALLDDLQRSDPTRKVTTAIQPGLIVAADPVLLRAALGNLLTNAWKFTARRPDAKIDVGMESRDGEPIYYVRDNGVGFDLAYAGQLFGPFQRLHAAKDFPGTGIGLATVQRIVHRHGGRIWADAAVNVGATFYFTIGAGGDAP